VQKVQKGVADMSSGATGPSKEPWPIARILAYQKMLKQAAILREALDEQLSASHSWKMLK